MRLRNEILHPDVGEYLAENELITRIFPRKQAHEENVSPHSFTHFLQKYNQLPAGWQLLMTHTVIS